jgi:hypothetical protein
MVGGIFINIFTALIRWAQQQRLNRAIRKANLMAERSGHKFFVLRYRRRFLVKSKQELRRLIREHYFVKGMTIGQIEKLALHITR